MYDVHKIRADFPILSRTVYNHPLIYLDNAATTQKPRFVVEAMSDEYYNVNANVHRGVHFLSQQATELHESARETVRAFIGARRTSEIIFTRGTTESINLVVASFGGTFLNDGDEVIITQMEHHANIVSWQLLQKNKNIRLRIIPVNEHCELSLDNFEQLFNSHTRFVALTHVSNVTGIINPIAQIIKIAHSHNVPVLIDGAQSTPHFPVNVTELDCDFFAFSGHKVYGPTGIGVLYGKEKWLDIMPPYMGGGEMIRRVSFNGTTFNDLPFKFEAGTPDYVAAVGLAHAINYITEIGLENIFAYEHSLTQYALSRLAEIPGIHIIGDSSSHDAVISFLVDNIHHSDMGTLLDKLGIAVRTGHHCAEPFIDHLGLQGTVRASFALYNTREEIDELVNGIQRVRRMF